MANTVFGSRHLGSCFDADVAVNDIALQLTYPGTRISTLEELFQFAECADPAHQILWNIESKINAEHPNRTFGVSDFVQKQGMIFAKSPYANGITVSDLVLRGKAVYSFVVCSIRALIGERSLR